MVVAGLLLALLVGLSLGLLGGGGSVLGVPIFVYVLDIPPKSAIAMSLAVVAVTSLSGVAGHWRAGNVNLRMALAFAAFAMTSSLLGAAASGLISGDVQLTIFAVVMFTAAMFMYRGRKDADPVQQQPGFGASAARIGIPALGVGFLTGLIGVGGGFLIVPVLVLLGRLPMKQAIGSSLVVIALTATTGFIGQLHQGVDVQWAFMAVFILIAVVGSFCGALLVPHIPQKVLRRGFALFLAVMAVFILYEKSSDLLSR